MLARFICCFASTAGIAIYLPRVDTLRSHQIFLIHSASLFPLFINRFDQHSFGKISLQTMSRNEEAERAFAEFDLDGDGHIDRNELKKALEKAGQQPSIQVRITIE